MRMPCRISDIIVRGQPANFGKIRCFRRDERIPEDMLPILAESTTFKLTKDAHAHKMEDARFAAPAGGEISN